MLTKKEIMEVFSARGCAVEDKVKDENWFFYTREGIHYEVQVDVDKESQDHKFFVIMCPCMGKVEAKYGHLLERAVNMMKKDLEDENIDQYQLDYNPEDCSVDSCMAIYYTTSTKQDLDKALISAFEFDRQVNDVITKNVTSWVRAAKLPCS